MEFSYEYITRLRNWIGMYVAIHDIPFQNIADIREMIRFLLVFEFEDVFLMRKDAAKQQIILPDEFIAEP